MSDNNDNNKLYLVNISFWGYNNGLIPVFAEDEEGVKKHIDEVMADAEYPPRELTIHSIVQSKAEGDEDMSDVMEARIQEIRAEKKQEEEKVIN